MLTIFKRIPLLFAFALLCSCGYLTSVEAGSGGQAAPTTPSLKTLQNPGGGTIVYGPIPGQQTYQTVLSVMLKKVEADYGDKPQMGNMLQSRNGNFWEGFFTFANKKQTGSTPMTGMVIVYAPQSGTAGGATLIDTTTNFTKSANSMLQNLVQTIQNGAKTAQSTPSNGALASSASSTGAKATPEPAQQLTPYKFPDGTGMISLPAGWKPGRAQMGDVIASGPNGETLRFGFVVEALDPNLPGSRALTGGRNVAPGNFVLIPFSEDPIQIYEQSLNQLSQKQRVPAPTFTAKQVQDMHAPSGKDFIMFGTVTKGGAAPADTIIQLLCSPENNMGYEIKIYQVSAPDPVFQQELATLNAIFPTYSQNAKLISQMATANAQEIQQITNNYLSYANNLTDSTDRMTQGMSDYLRGESVFVDGETGQHYRGPDDLASALQNANPNRFQTLSPGQYLQGVDY